MLAIFRQSCQMSWVIWIHVSIKRDKIGPYCLPTYQTFTSKHRKPCGVGSHTQEMLTWSMRRKCEFSLSPKAFQQDYLHITKRVQGIYPRVDALKFSAHCSIISFTLQWEIVFSDLMLWVSRTDSQTKVCVTSPVYIPIL